MLYHFANCLGLAYTPYYLTYKYSGLAEYGAFWKVGQASLMYILTQLAKMLFLATFFPMSELEEEEGGHKFDFFNDFLRATVDMADLVGIYLVMSRVSGKGSVKVLIAGLGWAFAEPVLTRLVFLWVGARGVEFDWRYIQKSFEANISLLHFITVATLVWMWTKRFNPLWRDHWGSLTGSGNSLLQGSHPGCSIKCDAAGKLGNTSPGCTGVMLPWSSFSSALLRCH